jgi:DNA-binding phage protein
MAPKKTPTKATPTKATPTKVAPRPKVPAPARTQAPTTPAAPAQNRPKAKGKPQASPGGNPDPLPLSTVFRQVIAARQLSAYAVGKAAGVDSRQVQRFLDRERDLRLATADKIARALGLRLVEGTILKAPVPGRARAPR